MARDPSTGIDGADLDRHITGNYGQDGPEGDVWECETCGEMDPSLRSDEEPVLCRSCNEALEFGESDDEEDE